MNTLEYHAESCVREGVMNNIMLIKGVMLDLFRHPMEILKQIQDNKLKAVQAATLALVLGACGDTNTEPEAKINMPYTAPSMRLIPVDSSSDIFNLCPEDLIGPSDLVYHDAHIHVQPSDTPENLLQQLNEVGIPQALVWAGHIGQEEKTRINASRDLDRRFLPAAGACSRIKWFTTLAPDAAFPDMTNTPDYLENLLLKDRDALSGIAIDIAHHGRGIHNSLDNPDTKQLIEMAEAWGLPVMAHVDLADDPTLEDKFYDAVRSRPRVLFIVFGLGRGVRDIERFRALPNLRFSEFPKIVRRPELESYLDSPDPSIHYLRNWLSGSDSTPTSDPYYTIPRAAEKTRDDFREILRQGAAISEARQDPSVMEKIRKLIDSLARERFAEIFPERKP